MRGVVNRAWRASFKKETGKPELPVERGVVTGILRIAKAELFSGLNNVNEYSLLDEEFATCYGFTQSEVDELLTKVPTETDPEQIKDWYNGYTFGEEVIYNPWSIMQCLSRKGKLKHYWMDSGGTAFIDKVFVSDEIQADVQELLEGNTPNVLILAILIIIHLCQYPNYIQIFIC